MRPTLILLSALLVFAAGLHAQDTEATPTSEPFTVLPNRVTKGAQGVKLVFSAASKDLFASTSLTSPTVVFGSGVTLVSGTFVVLNSSEAKATVNVDETALGGVMVRVSFYSRDGQSVIRQEQATIGVIGEAEIEESGLKIAADRVNLVAVNVPATQNLGAVTITGRANGIFTYTPPAGMLFESGETPVVTINGGGSIANIAVNAARTALTFSVINTASADVTVRIDHLMMDAETFGDGGGIVGNQASTITGTSLGEAEGLVINGHTALATLEGDEVIDETEAAEEAAAEEAAAEAAADDTSTSNNSSSSSSSSSSNSSTSSTSNNSNRNNTRRNRNNNSRPAVTNRASNRGKVAPPRSAARPNSNRWGNRGNRNNSNGSFKSPPRGFSGNRSGASANDSELTYMRRVDAETGSTNDGGTTAISTTTGELPAIQRMLRSDKLYFADKDFKRQDSLLLSGEGLRAWIVLERKEDLSDEIDTLRVSLSFGGEEHSVLMVETGAKTGVFHSAKSGIAISAKSGE